MMTLIRLFKRDTLNSQGTKLSRLVTEQLINSKDDCSVDFKGILTVTPLFFQDFIFPLITRFGSEILDDRLRLLNLKEDHLASYRDAYDQTGDYIDKLYAHQENHSNDLSNLTCELLIKARELSRTDLSAAQLIFGINSSLAKSFASMDIESIQRIANAGIICFEPRLSPEFAAQMAVLDATEIDVFLNIVGGLEDIYETQYL